MDYQPPNSRILVLSSNFFKIDEAVKRMYSFGEDSDRFFRAL